MSFPNFHQLIILWKELLFFASEEGICRSKSAFLLNVNFCCPWKNMSTCVVWQSLYFKSTLGSRELALDRRNLYCSTVTNLHYFMFFGSPTTKGWEPLAHPMMTKNHHIYFCFLSDPRKVHSEEESDCETLAEAPSYLSADSREKSANRNGTRGKRRTKASHNLARRRQVMIL